MDQVILNDQHVNSVLVEYCLSAKAIALISVIRTLCSVELNASTTHISIGFNEGHRDTILQQRTGNYQNSGHRSVGLASEDEIYNERDRSNSDSLIGRFRNEIVERIDS